MNWTRNVYAAAIVLSAIGPPAMAVQNSTAPQTEALQTARRSFTPDDFAQFAPRTALDMAQRIPGFAIREGGGERGLGQADTNVLINDQRVTAKANGVVDALGRIPARDVVRLEILDGAGLDIPGLSGQVLNVVSRSTGGLTGRFRYAPQFRSEGTPFRWGNGEISIAGGGSGTEWTLSLENDQQRFGDTGPEFVSDGSGALIDFRQEAFTEQYENPSLSGSYSRTSEAGSILNLTGSFTEFTLRGREVSDRTGPGQVDRVRVFRFTEDEYNYELGGDYEFDALGGRLKLIGYHRFEHSPTLSSVRTDFADGRAPEGSVFQREADEAESILRVEHGFTALGGDVQLSLEGANNTLDIVSRLDAFDAQGVLQPVALPGATAGVNEDRAEAALSYGRTLTPALQFQGSLGVEYSQISQTGAATVTRDFIRPKGYATFDWRPNDELDVSLRLERVVGQLNFFDFISSVNVNQGQVDVTNADLVPPQSWLLELEANRSFGALGSITVRGFYEDVTDIVDQIPITGGGQAPGNIDTALRYGGSLDATLLSEPLGWRGGRLDIEIDVRESEVADPLTGEIRRISGSEYLETAGAFRQDFQGTDLAAGLEYEWEREALEVRLDEISKFEESFAFASIFIEHKDVAGLTLRATVANVLDRDNDFSRTVFSDRSAGDVDFREERFRNFGTIYTLTVEGSF